MKTADLDKSAINHEQQEILEVHRAAEAKKLGEATLNDNENRIDAFRSLWGFRSYDFFGLARCLQVWDELRKLQTRPRNESLAGLWRLARGSDREGYISPGSGVQGDAVGFIKALGCLRAVSFEPTTSYYVLKPLHAEKLNNYGEVFKQTIGVRLLRREQQHFVRSYTEGKTGRLRTRSSKKWVTVEVASEVARKKKWVLFTLPTETVKPLHDSMDISKHPSVSWCLGLPVEQIDIVTQKPLSRPYVPTEAQKRRVAGIEAFMRLRRLKSCEKTTQ